MKPYGNAREYHHLILRAKDVLGLNWQQVALLFDISTSRAQQIVYKERARRATGDEGTLAVSREDG